MDIQELLDKLAEDNKKLATENRELKKQLRDIEYLAKGLISQELLERVKKMEAKT